MKNRKFVFIASTAIVLLIILSALPLLAQSNQINNFEYVGFNSSTYFDEFQWGTYTPGGEIVMQVKGGGITSVWLRLQNRKIEHLSTGKTRLSVTPLQNAVGTVLEYRVKVGNSAWSDTIELDFT